jgi:hypothetical protein
LEIAVKLKDISLSDVLAVLNYDQSTGLFTWKSRQDSRGRWNTRWIGKVAGNLNTSGHRQLLLNGRPYSANRVAWLISYGEWPEEHVDHINGCPDDNRIANLRLATNAENGWNSKINVRNSVGVKGVSYVAKRRKYQAAICSNGRPRRIGFYDTIEAAAEAYRTAALQEHGAFARLS